MKLYSVGQTQHNFLLNNLAANCVQHDTIHRLAPRHRMLHIVQFGGGCVILISLTPVIKIWPPCTNFHETHKYSPALCSDGSHPAPPKSDHNCAKYRQKFIYTHK